MKPILITKNGETKEVPSRTVLEMSGILNQGWKEAVDAPASVKQAKATEADLKGAEGDDDDTLSDDETETGRKTRKPRSPNKPKP